MQRVRIYGAPGGEKGRPMRVDMYEDGQYVMEVCEGPRTGGVFETLGEGQVVFRHSSGEVTKAEETDGGLVLAGATLPRATAGAFSASCCKAEEASKVTESTGFTMRNCQQKVDEAIYNSIHNHGVQPQLVLKPPGLLRALAAEKGVGGGGPPKIQGVVEDDKSISGISLSGREISYPDLRVLISLLGEGSALSLLDVSSAVKPYVPKEEIDAEAANLQSNWGPITEEEGNETFEKLKAALAPEEYTTQQAAFRQLAKSELCRMDMLLKAVAKNQSLTSLDLSYNTLGTLSGGRKSFKQLRIAKKAFEDHEQLTTLSLAGNNMGPKGTGVIIKGLIQNIHLASVDLSENGLADEEEEENDEDAEGDDPAFGEPLSGLEAVADLLKKNKFIRSLNLARNHIKKIEMEEEATDTFGSDTPFYKMLLPLRTFNRLTRLDLSGNELGEGGAFILGATVQRNTSLTSLDVSECDLGPKGTEHLAKHLQTSNQLRVLAMRRNGFAGLKGKKSTKASACAIAELAAYFSGPTNHLQKLDMAYNNMGPDACASVIEALQGSKGLEELDMSLNHMCGMSTVEFSPVAVKKLKELASSTRLETLKLKWNFLQSEGGVRLAEALGGSAITDLDVTQNHLKGGGVTAICKAADKLARLRIGANYSCGEAAAEVAALIGRSTALTALDVSDNKLGTDGGMAVLRSLKGSRLEALNISKNIIGEAGAPLLGDALAVLRTLIASDNNFGSQAIADHVIPKLAGNQVTRTLSVWGGPGDPTIPLEASAKLFADLDGGDEGPDKNGIPPNTTLLELDLGVPLVSVQSSNHTAAVNNFSQSLLRNLKSATFQSATEVALI